MEFDYEPQPLFDCPFCHSDLKSPLQPIPSQNLNQKYHKDFLYNANLESIAT